MYLEVQFKDKNLNWHGKTYDFELTKSSKPPKIGSVIRMLSEDGTKAVCNGTRVRVIAVKPQSSRSIETISYVESSLDEPSISNKKF